MIITTPERVSTYLGDKKGDRLPFSCTLIVLDSETSIREIIKFATMSLKAGAGVKVVIKSDFAIPEYEPFAIYQTIKDNSDTQYLDECYEPDLLNQSTPSDCHTITVEDSIESILSAVNLCFLMAKAGSGCVNVDLSNLRPRDTVNSKGLVASGAVIFSQLFSAISFYLQRQTMHSLLKLLGTLNAVILRGGYKKGIITSAIEDKSPLLWDYLNTPLVSLPGSHKKGIILSKYPEPKLLEVLLEKVNNESLFLQKHQPGKGYVNVCQGIFLKSRGTCLIYRLNLGLITEMSQIVPAFKEATRKAIYTHWEWRQLHPQRAEMWATLEDDNQVAVDVMGLANLLLTLGITYDEFIEALHTTNQLESKAQELVQVLQQAYEASSTEADRYCEQLGIPIMSRLHTVEPAQSHSYKSQDCRGNTVARGIWTPFSRTVNRMSQAANEKPKTYYYGEVEAHMSPEKHFELSNGYYELMRDYGRPHSMSYDLLATMGESQFKDWYASSLPATYYQLTKDYNTDYSRKVLKPVDLCSSCAY